MLFARGVWSIFGVRQSSLDKFREGMSDKQKLAGISQLAASIRTKFQGQPSYGINPFAAPRMDEGLTDQIGVKALGEKSSQEQAQMLADSGMGYDEFFGFNEAQFSLGDNQFAFWLTINDYEDVTDPKSKQEALAYRDVGRPFKFLNKEEKKAVEANVAAAAVASRVQFPVLVDFNSETVYVASGNVEQVGIVRSVIAAIGGEDFSLAWQFGGYDWPGKFLQAVYDKNNFSSDMASRADELSRFRPEEVEKLDDKMLESIVSTFFALSTLDTGTWAGLTTPARIRLFKPSDPAGASNPSVAFSLLREFDKAEIAAASVVFQSLDSRFNKKGEERLSRTDLLTIDVNDNVNLTDAGAAMLRGFDMPPFRKTMKQAAKTNSSLAIGDYWKEWLSSMKTAVNMFVENVTDTLSLDKQKNGLKPYESEASTEE